MKRETITPQEFVDRFEYYLAQDRDGEWWAYRDAPTIEGDRFGWISYGGGCYSVDSFFDIQWDGNWKDSLHSPRPNYKPGELILVWDKGWEYANVRIFYAWRGDGVLTFYNLDNEPGATWSHHRPFDRTLAETPIREWPDEDSC